MTFSVERWSAPVTSSHIDKIDPPHGIRSSILSTSHWLMPKRSSLFATAVWLPLVSSVVLAEPAMAQTAAPVGSSLGFGGVSTVEARHAEALLWNPAGLALPDAFRSSFTLPSITLDLGSSGAFPWSPFGLFSDMTRRNAAPVTDLRTLQRTARDGWARTVARGDVLWFGAHNDGFAIALSGHATSTFMVPARGIALWLGDADQDDSDLDPSAAPGSARSHTAVYTTFSIGKAWHIGAVPGLGHTWFGFAGRYSYVHLNAVGVPGHGRVEEVPGLRAFATPWDLDAKTFWIAGWEVRDARVVTADAGLIVNPRADLLVGVVFTAPYQTARFSSADYYRSTYLGTRFDDEGPMIRHILAPVSPKSLSPNDRKALDAVTLATRFPQMARIAASYDWKRLRISGTWSARLNDRDAIGLHDEERWALAVSGQDGDGYRIAIRQTLDGDHAFGFGITQRSCGRTTSWGAELSTGAVTRIRLGVAWTYSGQGCYSSS